MFHYTVCCWQRDTTLSYFFLWSSFMIQNMFSLEPCQGWIILLHCEFWLGFQFEYGFILRTITLIQRNKIIIGYVKEGCVVRFDRYILPLDNDMRQNLGKPKWAQTYYELWPHTMHTKVVYINPYFSCCLTGYWLLFSTINILSYDMR